MPNPNQSALYNSIGFQITFKIENIETIKNLTTRISSKQFTILKIIFLDVR